MAGTPGRCVKRHTRVYMDGYDFGAYLDGAGPLDTSFTESGFAALVDQVRGYLPGLGNISPGVLTGALDNTATTGLHTVLSPATAQGAKHNLLIVIGDGGAAPVAGSPTFSGIFGLDAYKAGAAGDAHVLVTLPMSPYDVNSEPAGYSIAWGGLLHPKAAETAANVGNTPNINNLASSANGGIFVWQITTSNGTATVSADDSANGTVWAALTGATSGSVDASVTPKSGQVALANAATVRQFLRFQVAFGTATTVTFVSALIRA